MFRHVPKKETDDSLWVSCCPRGSSYKELKIPICLSFSIYSHAHNLKLVIIYSQKQLFSHKTTAELHCTAVLKMAAPDDRGKLSQRGIINNILQWSLLSCVCIYLVLTRRESVSSMGSMEHLTSRILKNEEATKRNDVRITTLERMSNKLNLEHAVLVKTELESFLFGWYK